MSKVTRITTLITVRNPYFDKEYEVSESLDYIESELKNITLGNIDFLTLHTVAGEIIEGEIKLITINPANYGSIECRKKFYTDETGGNDGQED